MNNNERNKLAKDIIIHCRQSIQKKFPFFSIALYSLTLEVDEEIKALATDGYYLYYNPVYIINQYKDNKKTLYISILHTLLHCLLRHFSKKQYTYHQLFDASMDIAVFLMMHELGIVTHKSKHKLLSKIPLLEKIIKNTNNHGVAIYNEALSNEELEISILENSQLIELDNHIYWTKPKRKGIGAGLSARWNNLYSQIGFQLQVGRQQGFNAGNFAQLFLSEDSEESKMSYTDILKRLSTFEEIFKVDIDTFDLMWYTTGLEMYEDMPIIEYVETKEDYVVNEFVLAIDTSGSCSGDVMQNFLSQTIKIFKDMEIGNRRINVKILQCDTEIVDEKDITTQDDIENYTNNFEAFGFGGTSFVPVFNRINDLQGEGKLSNLKGLIYLSDGMGDFPSERPSYETIFVMSEDEYGYFDNQYVPEWVTVCELD